jgi:Domain of unknown function (DUF222)
MLSVAERERLKDVITPDAGPSDLDALEQALAEVEAVEPERLSGYELRRRMQRLDTARCRLEATMARLVTEDARRGEPGERPEDREEGTIRWMEQHLHLNSSAAYAQVRFSRKLQELTATRAALARGEISARQAAVICRAMDEYRAHGLDGELEGSVESQLLHDARTMDPGELLKQWHRLRYQIDQAAGVAAEQEAHRQCWFRLREKWDGRYSLEGELDPEGGAILRTALHSLMKQQRPANDERTPDQRRAASLTALARRLMDAGRLPRRGGQRPHLTIVADLSTLRLEPGSKLARMDWGPGMTGESARRIGCDCTVTPVVTDKGRIVHVGRATRTVSSRMRKAVNVRDEHCQGPGCTVPAAECTVHHVEHWADSKVTTFDKLRLYCDYHHRQLHPENERFYKHPP